MSSAGLPLQAGHAGAGAQGQGDGAAEAPAGDGECAGCPGPVEEQVP